MIINPDDVAVATPDHRATHIGRSILERGGSATDAVIAASAMLCVVYPHNVTIGGDTWTLVGTPEGEPVAVNGTGRAPVALSAEFLHAQGFEAMPSTGPQSITVPGLVAAWADLHERFGRLPFAELIAPARAAAREGVAVARALGRDLVQHLEALRQDPGCAEILLRADGSVPQVGERLRQPQLADTLDRIAADPMSLYTGDVGGQYAGGLAAAGSLITAADLAGHRTEFVDPLSLSYRGLQVYTSPPNSQGFTLLLILALLEELELDDVGSPDQVAVSAVVADRSGRVRDEQLADPVAMDADAVTLLGRSQLAELAAEIRASRTSDAQPVAAGGPEQPKPYLGGDTIGIAARDASGCWVSSVQSVAGTFGSRVLEPSTGILAHNRGSGFSLDPRHPGYLVGGRRPPHTLMPCLVRRDGHDLGALATMGGHSQPIILAQVLNRILHGDHPQDAVAAPRWVVQRADRPEALVLVDAEAPEAVRVALRAAGPVTEIAHQDNRMGHCHAIWQSPSGVLTGTDPRADGLAPSEVRT
jgi:gamma-glutamyltranspeptidase/glutathione hydrolase